MLFFISLYFSHHLALIILTGKIIISAWYDYVLDIYHKAIETRILQVIVVFLKEISVISNDDGKYMLSEESKIW